MKKSLLFCICYICLLFIPALTMNTEKNVVSEIDNTYLPEFELDMENLGKIGTYVEKRIGGRNDMILAYELFNYQVFDILVHPMYMYGQDEWVYLNTQEYINDYLKINVDYDYAKQFAEYQLALSEIAEESGAQYLYVLCVDKKTIYPEYFVKGLNPSDGVSRTDVLLEEISKTGINYLCARETLLEAKESGVQVYNQKYDAGHWNEDGAFLVCQEIYDRLREHDPRIPMLSKEDYNIGTITQKYLLTSEFPINEEVPYYENKTSNARVDATYDDLVPGTKVFFRHYVNDVVDSPKALIFRDSYIGDMSKFFVENFSETTFASYSNLTSIDDFRKYLEIFQPDVVIFENAERTLPLSICN